MPYYKIAYSIAFVVILSAIQPVVYANEIGQAVERAVSLLAVVFCADTYLVEVQSKRSEVFCLYNLKKQAGVVYKRLFVQVAYLIGISLLAYGLFYWQKPVNLTELKKTLEKIKEELFVEQRGKNSLSLEKILKDILDGEYEKNERLDAVLAAMLHCSRGQASELIEAGRVEINHLPADKPHAQVYEGDVFTVRGKGRFRLTALPGKSKKDRSIIEFFQY